MILTNKFRAEYNYENIERDFDISLSKAQQVYTIQISLIFLPLNTKHLQYNILLEKKHLFFFKKAKNIISILAER